MCYDHAHSIACQTIIFAVILLKAKDEQFIRYHGIQEKFPASCTF